MSTAFTKLARRRSKETNCFIKERNLICHYSSTHTWHLFFLPPHHWCYSLRCWTKCTFPGALNTTKEWQFRPLEGMTLKPTSVSPNSWTSTRYSKVKWIVQSMLRLYSWYTVLTKIFFWIKYCSYSYCTFFGQLTFTSFIPMREIWHSTQKAYNVLTDFSIHVAFHIAYGALNANLFFQNITFPTNTQSWED